MSARINLPWRIRVGLRCQRLQLGQGRLRVHDQIAQSQQGQSPPPNAEAPPTPRPPSSSPARGRHLSIPSLRSGLGLRACFATAMSSYSNAAKGRTDALRRRNFHDHCACRRRPGAGQTQGARAALCRLPGGEGLAYARGEAEDPGKLGRGPAAAVCRTRSTTTARRTSPDITSWRSGAAARPASGAGSSSAKSGRIIALPSVSGWFDTHDKFEGIDFRHNSRLLVLSGARNEKKGDMGQHFYVLENGKLRLLKTIKQGRNFMEPNR